MLSKGTIWDYDGVPNGVRGRGSRVAYGRGDAGVYGAGQRETAYPRLKMTRRQPEKYARQLEDYERGLGRAGYSGWLLILENRRG